MVQVEISQLSGECTAWREKLRQYKEEFQQDEFQLRQVAGQALSKDQLQDVEHLHNQFHIQLINIHDLKQVIKIHERKVDFERSANDNQLNEDTVAEHENLLADYQHLEQKLLELRDEFDQFLQRT